MLYRKEILATINIAHHFESAFTADQVYRYLQLKMDREWFDETVNQLKREKIIFEGDNALFTKNLKKLYRRKKFWSRSLFEAHRFYLETLSRLPWVKFLALTGANSFESCRAQDDIDIFVVTAKNRLWACYVALMVFSKLSWKRQMLCINFLVDEDHLYIRQQDYFTAVQIMQMIPLFDSPLRQQLIENNRWIFDFLPNADDQIMLDNFYLLGKNRLTENGKKNESRLLTNLNRFLFQKYSRRLVKKFPEAFGKGIVLEEGAAKLNRVDHNHVYNELFRKEREAAAV